MSPLDAIREGQRISLEALVNYLQLHIPRLAGLKEIAHNFGETLFDHTDQALEAAYGLLEQQAFSADQRLALVLGVALHDIGKTFCTRVIQDRIVAPEHAERGRSYLAYPLAGLNLPYPIFAQILGLVGQHHSIGKTLQGATHGKFWRLASEVNVTLLYFLAKANLEARSDIDTEKAQETLELFKLFAQEYGVWGISNPYQKWEQELVQQFPKQGAWLDLAMGNIRREHGLGLITSLEEGIARNYRYQAGFADFAIFFGPEGSQAKQWVGAEFANYKRVVFADLQASISKGRARKVTGQVLQTAREQIKAHLHHQQPVVWDAHNLMADLRDGWVNLGIRYRALVTLIVFIPSLDELYKNTGDPKRLDKQLEMLEFPSVLEAHRTLFVGPKGEIGRSGFVA